MRMIGQVFADLLKKTGFDHLDANLKDIIALTTPVTDEVEQKLFSLLNTEEARAWAKSQPDIKAHYTSQAYNGWDAKIMESAEKLGLTEDEKEAIKKETRTGKRQELLNEFVEKHLEEQKKAAGSTKGKEDLEAKWKAEFEKLNASKTKEKEEFENLLKKKDESLYSFKKNTKINSVLGSQKWSENYPEGLRSELGMLAIQKALEKEGAMMALDEKDEIKLVRIDNPEMPYFDKSNKTPNFGEFATKILSENKFLAVSTPVQQNNHNSVMTSQSVASNTPKRSNSVLSLIQQSQKDQQD